MDKMILIISFIGCWIGTIYYPKTKKIDFLGAISFAYINVLCYGALGAFILNLLKVPISTFSMAGIYFLALCITCGIIAARKEVKKLELHRSDIFAVITGLIMIGGFSLYIFTGYLHLNYYNTVDPGTHYSWAMETLRNKSISGMYFSQLHNAMFIDIFGNLLPTTWTYKIFILADCFQNLMGYYLVYGFINYLRDNKKGYISIVISVVYWLGYPLYSFAAGGYIYWSMGAIIVIYLIWLLLLYTEVKNKRKYCMVQLLIGVFSLAVCYVQFVPGMILSYLLVVANDNLFVENKLKTMGKKGYLLIGILVSVLFLIAGCGYYIIFASRGLDIFYALKLGVNSSRNVEIIIIFPIIYFILYRLNKESKKDVIFWVNTAWIISYTLFVILALFNKISTYYLYKNNFILWIIIFITLSKYWGNFGLKEKMYIKHYLFIVVGFLILTYTPEKELENTQGFHLENSIYRYNILLFMENSFRDTYAEDKIDLIEYVGENYDTDSEAVLLITTNMNKGTCLWYGGVTGQPYYFSAPVEKDMVVKYIENNKIPYIMMFYDTEAYDQIGDYFEKYEKIYDSEQGFIVKYN